MIPERPAGGIAPGRRDLLVAAALAVAVFLLYHGLLSGLGREFGNFSKYPLAAAQLAAGRLDAERAGDFSPLYLRLCTWLEVRAADPFPALVRIQGACVAAACAALFLALRRQAGAAAALLGAGALALYPGLVTYAYIFEPEPLMVLWLSLLLLFAGCRGPAAPAAAGATLALCVCTRPGFWPLLAAFAASYALEPGRERRLRPAAVLLAAFAATWTAFAVLLAPAPPSPSTMNPGTVFYDGNNPLAEGVRAEYPGLVLSLADDFPGEGDYQHALYRLVARRSAGREWSRGEVNAWWAARALAYAADHPGAWLAAAARKAFHALHAHRWHDLRIAWLVDQRVSRGVPSSLPAAPVAALALAGVLLWRRSWRTGVVALAGLGLQLLTMILTYASERQRLSLWPFLCFFAAIGVSRIAGRRARLGVTLAVLLAAALLARDHDLARDDRETSAAVGALPEAVARTARLRDAGRLAEAAEAHAQAMALAPWAFAGGARPERLPATGTALAARAEEIVRATRPDTPSARLDRAVLLIGAGLLDEAEALLAGLKAARVRLLRRERRIVDPDYWLALVAARRGDQTRAVALLRDALARRPGDPTVLAPLAVLGGDASGPSRIERYFGAADAAQYLGDAALAWGAGERAVEPFRELVRRLPEERDAGVGLAAALFEAGRLEEASGTYLEAMRARPEPVLWEREVLGGFERLAAATPPGDFARYLQGRVLRQFGRLPEARAVLAAAYAASGKEVVARELRAVEGDLAAAGVPAGGE